MGRAIGRDFDSWRELAEKDPEGFENRRRAVIDAAIASAPEANRQRLRCLQWRIDRTRERAPNPMAACVALSKMMWERITGREGLLEAIGRLQGQPPPQRLPARVLDLPRRPPH
jgi:hypothetical protein